MGRVSAPACFPGDPNQLYGTPCLSDAAARHTDTQVVGGDGAVTASVAALQGWGRLCNTTLTAAPLRTPAAPPRPLDPWTLSDPPVPPAAWAFAASAEELLQLLTAVRCVRAAACRCSCAPRACVNVYVCVCVCIVGSTAMCIRFATRVRAAPTSWALVAPMPTPHVNFRAPPHAPHNTQQPPDWHSQPDAAPRERVVVLLRDIDLAAAAAAAAALPEAGLVLPYGLTLVGATTSTAAADGVSDVSYRLRVRLHLGGRRLVGSVPAGGRLAFRHLVVSGLPLDGAVAAAAVEAAAEAVAAGVDSEAGSASAPGMAAWLARYV